VKTLRTIGIALGVATLVFIGRYWLNQERIWTLTDRNGRSLCRVKEGWNEKEVAAHCGIRSGRGTQPKVLASGRGLDIQTCSAPGDVYGGKVVFYGCDGKVASVETLPAHDFIYYPARN
jgi:hypothetical protein